jgi:DNA-binding NarL/FixJ family response regulator
MLNNDAGRTPNALTVIGFVDSYSFTRECIAASLQMAAADLRVLPYSSCADAVNNDVQHDLFLFLWHSEDSEHERRELTAANKALTPLAPVIVLCAAEQFESISHAFEKGARGYIPLRSTPPGLAIEIIRFVKAGGTFVPLSGLSLSGTQADGATVRVSAHDGLTMRERDVLKLLKQGKANKITAYELQLSESTIKLHIRNIMRKMKVSNRTEVICYSYTTDMSAIDVS